MGLRWGATLAQQLSTQCWDWSTLLHLLAQTLLPLWPSLFFGIVFPSNCFSLLCLLYLVLSLPAPPPAALSSGDMAAPDDDQDFEMSPPPSANDDVKLVPHGDDLPFPGELGPDGKHEVSYMDV
jgi:hypothetical protein